MENSINSFNQSETMVTRFSQLERPASLASCLSASLDWPCVVTGTIETFYDITGGNIGQNRIGRTGKN